MEEEKLKIGEDYYYAKDPKKMRCTSIGEEQSSFIDYKQTKYKFYNEDIYTDKYSK